MAGHTDLIVYPASADDPATRLLHVARTLSLAAETALVGRSMVTPSLTAKPPKERENDA